VARGIDPTPDSHDHDRRLSRRDFVGRAAVATAAVVGTSVVAGAVIRRRGEARPWDDDAFAPPGQARVAVVSRASYAGDLTGVVLDGLRAIAADVSGARVLLKPNLVEYDPGSVINTDPRLVAATIEAMRRLGAASVIVAEGPGHRRDTTYVMRASGLLEAMHDVDAPFIDLNVAPATPVGLRSHYTPLSTLWIPEAIRTADVVVSMPKMKTHHWAGVTLSLKNCFGCLPGRVYGWPKNALHWVGIDNAIVDVVGAVRPSYAIIDGIVAMEGNGPIDGTSKQMGVLVFGDDPVATDTTAATMMGFDPSRITYLREAARFLGQGDTAQILQVGEDPSAHMSAFQPAPGTELAASSGSF
jgi:uncharacterized protein (DUF362 family)